MALVIGEVAQVRDIRLLEEHHRIAAGMPRAVVPRRDGDAAERLPPPVTERRVGVCLWQRLGAGRVRLCPLKAWHPLVRHDHLRRRLEDGVAAYVIAMMMRVDDGVDRASRALRETIQADCGRIRELRIDNDDRVRGDCPSDGAAVADKYADTVA